ncbi:MAG: hypothetical protein NTX53_13945 [candidate division WOR-3 bacterium]|nr:hypothetical protein [candidate division WOR-3 bacterium]
MSESSKSAGMKRLSRLRSGHLVARLARLIVSVALLFVGGCPLFVMDQNAYQTGKVLQTGKVRLSASTFSYFPMRASVDVGLGRRWEVGAGFGRTVSSWDWSGDLSVTRSIYSSRRLFSSVLLQAELARGGGLLKPLGRVTTAAALSYWPEEGFGIYMPLRLSMLFASPATFPYRREVWNDSLGEYVHVPAERVFHGLHDPVLTAGFGLANEYKRFYSRLAITFPVIGPHVERDSVNAGFELWPYVGFQLGLRVF